jgi:hypothetical protein
MALTYDQISAITERKFIPKVIDNIFDSDPLLQRAKSKGWYKKIDGGTSIIVPPNYAKNTSGGWYQGADTLSTVDNDVITGAEYAWKQGYENITVSRLDELKNSGDAQMVDFVKSKTQICEKTWIDRLGDGLYSAGTDAKSIVGLRNVANSSSTIGGISQTTYTWWSANVDSTTTTLSMAALQTMDTALTINNEGRPSIRRLAPTITATTRSSSRSSAFMDSETAKGGFSSPDV